LLANQCKEKKIFLKLLFFVILTLPIISSTVHVFLRLPWIKYSLGSSGIISSLASFMPIFGLIYLSKKNEKINFDIRMPLILLIYIFLIFAYKYSLNFFYLLLTVIFLLSFLYSLRTSFKYILLEIRKEIEFNLLRALLLIISFLIFIIVPLEIFPSLTNIFNEEVFVDFLVHYVGISYGIIISGFYFVFSHKIENH